MPAARTLRNREVWIKGSAITAALALGALVLGVVEGRMVWALLGLAAIIAGVVAIVLHRGLGDKPARSLALRTRRLRGELATWSGVLPLALVLLAMALDPVTAPPPDVTRISGKPAEIRSETRRVIMPDGRSYAFWCGGTGRDRRSDCPAMARWKALPRWPEPEHVEMLVDGQRILGLTMDGEIIVDPVADRENRGLRWPLGLAGLGLAGAAIRAIWRRGSQLRSLKASTPRKLDD